MDAVIPKNSSQMKNRNIKPIILKRAKILLERKADVVRSFGTNIAKIITEPQVAAVIAMQRRTEVPVNQAETHINITPVARV